MTNHNFQLIKLKDRSQEWKDFDERLEILHQLSTILYMWPRCSCGGPFHVMLDDFNFYEKDLDFCAQEIEKEEWKGIREVGVAIISMLRTLSVAQRVYWSQHRTTDDVLAVSGKDVEWDNKNSEWKVKE